MSDFIIAEPKFNLEYFIKKSGAKLEDLTGVKAFFVIANIFDCEDLHTIEKGQLVEQFIDNLKNRPTKNPTINFDLKTTNTVTIGYIRSDGDLAVLSTLNNDGEEFTPEAWENHVFAVAKNYVDNEIDIEVFAREDAYAIISLDDEESEEEAEIEAVESKRPLYYALKDVAVDNICFAVVAEKETHEKTMESFRQALKEQFDAECETPDLDLSGCVHGKRLEFVAKLKNEDGTIAFGEYSIEVEQTWLY